MKAIKRAIILCWIMLIVCFIIKLFGGNWFEIICNNEHFINVCNYLDTHAVVRYCIAFPIYVVSTFFIICACSLCPKPNKKQAITILVCVSCVWFLQLFNQYVKMVFEILIHILMPFITRRLNENKELIKTTLKKTWYLGIIGYIISFVFQIISLITKNVGIKVIDDNTLISLIFMIDFYIMVALYYLYILLKNKKGEQGNGNMGNNISQ